MELSGELWDNIVDHLHDDKRALASCGLTCRSLVPSARYHLFGTVRLTKKDDEHRVSEVFTLGEDGVAGYIRDFTFNMEDSQQWAESVVDRLPLLQSINRLSLIGLGRWDLLSTKVRQWLDQLFPMLDYLALEFVRFTQPSIFFGVVQSAPALQTLILRFVKVGYPETAIKEMTFFRPPPITTLILQGNEMLKMTPDWIDISLVRTFGVSRLQAPHMKSTSAILHRMAAGLLSLSVNLSTFEDHATFCRNLDIGPLLHLRTLRFPVQTWSRASPWVVDILSRVTSPILEEVIIILDDKPEGIRFQNLSPLGVVFRVLPTSTKLRFDILTHTKTMPQYEMSKGILQKNLSGLEKEGRLACSPVLRDANGRDAALWRV